MPLGLLARRDWRWIAAVGGLVIAGAIIAVKFFSNETLVEASTNIVECKISHDADCLLRYVDPAEAAAYNLDRQQFAALVNEYYRPVVGGRRRLGGVVVHSEPAQEQSTASITLVGEGGAPVIVTGTAVRMVDGPKSPRLISEILLEAGRARHLPVNAKPANVRTMEALAAMAVQDANVLEDLGVKGVIVKDRDGSRMESWTVFAQTMKKKVALLEAAQSSPSRPD